MGGAPCRGFPRPPPAHRTRQPGHRPWAPGVMSAVVCISLSARSIIYKELTASVKGKAIRYNVSAK